MKLTIQRLVLSAGLVALLAAPAVSTFAADAAVTLPYGVEDVLRLSRANVNEDIILKFIQNSGTVYQLGAKEIVYLQNQGVKDIVISAMLEQKQRNLEATPLTVPTETVASTTPAAPATAPAAPQPTYYAPAPYYYAPPATVIEPAPSTVYVIPYQGSGYFSRGPYYAGSYRYYGPGFSVYAPGFSFGFGFGGHHHHHGGWHR